MHEWRGGEEGSTCKCTHAYTHECIGVHLWITGEARGQCHMHYPVTPLPYF